MCLRFVFVNFDAMYSMLAALSRDVAYFDMNDVEKGQLWHKLKYVRLDDNASSQSPSPIWHLGTHSQPVSQFKFDTYLWALWTSNWLVIICWLIPKKN